MFARLIFYNGKSPNNRRSKKESKDVGIENFDGRRTPQPPSITRNHSETAIPANERRSCCTETLQAEGPWKEQRPR